MKKKRKEEFRKRWRIMNNIIRYFITENMYFGQPFSNFVVRTIEKFTSF